MTPGLADRLREAGLWDEVLLDNARTGTEWRKAVSKARADGYAAAREDAAKVAEEVPNPSGNPWEWPDTIAAAIRALPDRGKE